MKARGGFTKDFRFTEEQRNDLARLLRGGREKSLQLLTRVEHHIMWYLEISKEFKKDPPSSRGTQLREIAQLNRLLDKSRTALSSIDAATWQSYFVWGLTTTGVRTPYEFVERASNDMLLMQSALRFAREKLPKPRVGHPTKDLEIGLITEIAVAYEQVYGKLPPRRPESRFSDFITQIFGYLDSDQIDFSRLIEQAIGHIVALRKA